MPVVLETLGPIPWGAMNCLKPEISPSALDALGASELRYKLLASGDLIHNP